MSKRDKPIVVRVDPVRALRVGLGADRVADLRDGRVQRSHTFRPKKGRGSYTRRSKHKEG